MSDFVAVLPWPMHSSSGKSEVLRAADAPSRARSRCSAPRGCSKALCRGYSPPGRRKPSATALDPTPIKKLLLLMPPPPPLLPPPSAVGQTQELLLLLLASRGSGAAAQTLSAVRVHGGARRRCRWLAACSQGEGKRTAAEAARPRRGPHSSCNGDVDDGAAAAARRLLCAPPPPSSWRVSVLSCTRTCRRSVRRHRAGRAAGGRRWRGAPCMMQFFVVLRACRRAAARVRGPARSGPAIRATAFRRRRSSRAFRPNHGPLPQAPSRPAAFFCAQSKIAEERNTAY